MGTDLLVAVISVVVSFLVFYKLLSLINRAFDINVPGWLAFIILILLAAGLYYKKDFFFGSPITTGATIGFLLALLWNIRDASFVSGLLKGILSFKFLIWAAVTAVGIYKRDIVLGLWDKYVADAAASVLTYALILALIIYIAGSIFILVPTALTKKRGRSPGFSMHRRASKSGIVFAEILGSIMAFLGSAFIIDAYTFFTSK